MAVLGGVAVSYKRGTPAEFIARGEGSNLLSIPWSLILVFLSEAVLGQDTHTKPNLHFEFPLLLKLTEVPLLR